MRPDCNTFHGIALKEKTRRTYRFLQCLAMPRTPLLPDPTADVFERRHLQPRDLIQIIVVEFGAKLGDALFDLAEIAQPFLLLVGLTLEKDLNLERVAVQP